MGGQPERVRRVEAHLVQGFWKQHAPRAHHPIRSQVPRSRQPTRVCVYNSTFEQHTHTPAWVEYLVRHLADPVEYALVRAWRVSVPPGATVMAPVSMPVEIPA